MEFDDVRNILRKTEFKIKDYIKISELLPFLEFSDHSRQHIEAQIREHGSPHASSLFFDNIRSRPSSFYTLIAALLHHKIDQRDIYDIILKEIRKCFKKKPDKLRELLQKIWDAKRKLGVKDDEDTSGSNDDEEVRTRRPCQQLSSRPHGRSPQTSPDSNTEPDLLYSRTGVLGSLPGARYERRPEPAPAPQPPPAFIRNTGGGRPLSQLRASVHKRLETEMIRTSETGQPYWEVISESERINLDISIEEHERIEGSARPGREFLQILRSQGYSQEELGQMFELANMREALHILRQHQNEVVPPDRALRPTQTHNMAGPGVNLEPNISSKPTYYYNAHLNMAVPGQSLESNNISRPTSDYNRAGPGDNQAASRVSRSTNDLNRAGPGDNLEDQVKALNITEDQQCSSLPADIGRRAEVQPTQVSGETSLDYSMSSNSSSSSSNSEGSYPSKGSSPSKAGQKPTRAIQPVQPQSDPDNLAAAPSAHMDVQKLRQDRKNAALNMTRCGIEEDNTGTQPGGAMPDQSLTDTMTAAAPDDPGGTAPISVATGNKPSTTQHTTPQTAVVSPFSVTGPDSMSSYGEDSSDFSVLENITRDAGATSVSMSTMDVDSVSEETELKGTVAMQPTTDRAGVQPDARREAEKLREDRIHQLDDDPAAVDSSFTDIQQCTKQRDNLHQDSSQQEVDGGTHVFRSTLTEPDLVDEPSAEGRQDGDESQGPAEVMERSEMKKLEVISQDRISSETANSDDTSSRTGGVPGVRGENGPDITMDTDTRDGTESSADFTDSPGNRPNLSIFSSQQSYNDPKDS